MFDPFMNLKLEDSYNFELGLTQPLQKSACKVRATHHLKTKFQTLFN